MSAPNQEGRIVFGDPPPNLVMPVRDLTPEEKAAEAAAEEHQAALEKAALWAVRRAQLMGEARAVLGTAFELAGLGLASWGLYQLAAWIGITFAGIGLIIIGVAIDPPPLRPGREEAAESSDG